MLDVTGFRTAERVILKIQIQPPDQFIPDMSFELGQIAGGYEFVAVVDNPRGDAVYKVRNVLADRFDAMKVMGAGLVLSSVGVLLVPFTTGLTLVMACVVGGIGVGTVWTNSDAMVSQLAKRGRTASALGIAGSFKELGDMLGPLLIGALTQAFGLKVSFMTCGVIGLSSTVFLGIAAGKRVEVEGAESL